jgi:hypothetical protein
MEIDMATSLDNIHEDLRFYEELKVHAFGKVTKRIDEHNKFLIEHGVLQIETLLELAISRAGGLVRDATTGRDFADGSDAKKATSSWRNNNIRTGEWTNSHAVRNIKAKTGALRVMAFNRYADCFDYYVIPRRAYAHLNSNSIDITLDKFSSCYSEPTPTGRRSNSKWDIYRKANFVQMAKARGI